MIRYNILVVSKIEKILQKILRDNKIIIPRSNFVFKKNDTVVFLAKREELPLIENIFRISGI